jgi:hypothetical protein
VSTATLDIDSILVAPVAKWSDEVKERISAIVAAALRVPSKKRAPRDRQLIEQWALQMSRAGFLVRDQNAALLRCFRRDMLRRIGANWSGSDTTLLVTLYLDPLAWTPEERAKRKQRSAYRPTTNEERRLAARLFLLNTNALRGYRAYWYVHEKFASSKTRVTTRAQSKEVVVSHCVPRELACPASECVLKNVVCERVENDRKALEELLETNNIIRFAGIDENGGRVQRRWRIEAVFLHFVNVCVARNWWKKNPTFLQYTRKRVGVLKAKVAAARNAREARHFIGSFAESFNISKECEMFRRDDTRLSIVAEQFSVPVLRCYWPFVQRALQARLARERAGETDLVDSPAFTEEERLLRLKDQCKSTRLSPLQLDAFMLRALSCLELFWDWDASAGKPGADDPIMARARELRVLCSKEPHGLLQHRRIAELLCSTAGSVRKAYCLACEKIDGSSSNVGSKPLE